MHYGQLCPKYDVLRQRQGRSVILHISNIHHTMLPYGSDVHSKYKQLLCRIIIRSHLPDNGWGIWSILSELSKSSQPPSVRANVCYFSDVTLACEDSFFVHVLMFLQKMDLLDTRVHATHDFA